MSNASKNYIVFILFCFLAIFGIAMWGLWHDARLAEGQRDDYVRQVRLCANTSNTPHELRLCLLEAKLKWND